MLKSLDRGKEYGSKMGWNEKDMWFVYMDEKFQNNILLTQTERLTMNGRPANLNVQEMECTCNR